MSAWRRKALAMFPDLRNQLQSEERDLPSLFNELEDVAELAHQSKDSETLRRIHGYAEWCLRQGGDLWVHAGMGFYENLFMRVPWDEIVPWLSPFVVDQIRETWAVLGRERVFERLVNERREYLYRGNVWTTGELDAV
jgi:hypothetical protein